LAKIFFKIITSVPGASTYICTKSNGTVKHSFRVLYFAVYGDSAPDAGFSLTNFCYYSYFYLSTYEVSYNATYVMEPGYVCKKQNDWCKIPTYVYLGMKFIRCYSYTGKIGRIVITWVWNLWTWVCLRETNWLFSNTYLCMC
jgi:hypothetical protein